MSLYLKSMTSGETYLRISLLKRSFFLCIFYGLHFGAYICLFRVKTLRVFLCFLTECLELLRTDPEMENLSSSFSRKAFFSCHLTSTDPTPTTRNTQNPHHSVHTYTHKFKHCTWTYCRLLLLMKHHPHLCCWTFNWILFICITYFHDQ